jgi:hypothetical protein
MIKIIEDGVLVTALTPALAVSESNAVASAQTEPAKAQMRGLGFLSKNLLG